MYEELLKELIREKGGTREQYLKLLDYISFHETGGTMDPTTLQRSDNKDGIGPGRGKYQFEGPDGSNRLLTAANRTAAYFKQLGKPIPDYIKRIQKGDVYDATQLHPEAQDTLVLGDLRMKGGLDLKDYVEGRMSPEDLWVDHWWSGSKDQRPQQRNKFVKDMKRYDSGLQNPETQQSEFSLVDTQPTASTEPQQIPQKLDFIPNLFRYGGNMYPNGGGLNNGGGKKKPVYVDDTNDPRYKSYQDSLYLHNFGNRLEGAYKQASGNDVKAVNPKSVYYSKLKEIVKPEELMDNWEDTDTKKLASLKPLLDEFHQKGNKSIKPVGFSPYMSNPDNMAKDLVTGRAFMNMFGAFERAPGARIPQWKKPEREVIVDKSKSNKKSTNEKEPIYVDSPNDPRYVAYKDSLGLYNKTSYFQELGNDYLKGENIFIRNNPNEFNRKSSGYDHFTKDINSKIKPVKVIGFDDGEHSFADIPLFKKPEQPVILKNREPNLDTDIVAYLQSQGQPHSFVERKKRFKEMFPNEDYKGSAEQNIKLLQSIKTGETSQTSQPIENVENIESSTIQQQPVSPKRLHFQYGYYNDSGEFKIKDYKHNEQGRKEYEESKKKPGFRKINPESFTQESWRTQPDDRFNYNPDQLKLGGNLTNPNTMNDINMFNEGGTHESNPMGGIPQGVGQNGQINTVEEGEGRMGDMIYSDRIPLTEEAIMAVGLPKKFVGKTPAQALAEIEKTFKDRGDRSAQETKKDFADKIAQAQEMIKQQQAEIDQSMAANAQEVPDMMGGEIPQGMEEFMQPEQMMGDLPMEQDGRLQTGMQEQPQMFRMGGKMKPNRYQFGGFFKGQQGQQNMSTLGTGMSGIGYKMTANNNIIAGEQQDNQIVDGVKDTVAQVGGPVFQLFRGIQKMGQGIGNSVGGGVGAGISDAFSPEESTIAMWKDKDATPLEKIGGTVPILGGVLAHKAKKEKEQKEMLRNTKAEHAMYNSDFKYGGKVNKYADGRNLSLQHKIQPYSELDFSEPSTINPLMQINFPNQGYYSTPDGKTYGKNPNSLTNPENLKKAGRMGNSLLRAAPIAMNLAQLRGAGKYDKVSPMLNQTRFQPKYMDERAAQNLADSEMNNQIRGISQLGGSQGAVRSSMLGAGLNRAKTLGASMTQAQAQNNQMDVMGQQFDNQITEANLARRIGAEDRTAMNKGQAATNKSRLLAQIGQDIGNIGKENVYKEIAKITGYRWLGDFIQRNPNASEKELIAEAQKYVAKEEPTTNAYGGKLKLKRY